MPQLPTHPIPMDHSTNQSFGLLSELVELIMPPTKETAAPDQDHEINRPLADDYQPPYQGVTGSGGLDIDTQTRDWQPDVDRIAPVEYEPPRPYTPNIVNGPPVPVTIVPTPADTYTVSQFRTVFGPQMFYAGQLYILDPTTVTQIVPFDLARTNASIIVTGTPQVGGKAPNYVFAVSNNRDGTDYIVLDTINQKLSIPTTGEIWAGIVPLVAYVPANTNNLTLAVQLDSIYTGVSSS